MLLFWNVGAISSTNRLIAGTMPASHVSVIGNPGFSSLPADVAFLNVGLSMLGAN